MSQAEAMMPKTHRGQRRAWRLLGALSAGILLVSLAPNFAAGQTDDFVNGSGRSFAQFVRVGPTAAQLSLAPTFGLSLSDYLSTVGRGEVKVADWAALGVAEPALPDNTPVIKVDSRDQGSAAGRTEYVIGGDSGNGDGGLFQLHARANEAPFGASRFTFDRLGIPGLMEADGGVARTHAGIVEGDVREAVAVVTIRSVDLFDGTAALHGLRWEAVQRTGDDGKTVSGSFTIQGAQIGGVPLPLPNESNDIRDVLDELNAAIAPTGFAIRAPVPSSEADVASVSPLAIEIVDSELGRMFVAPILEAAQPIREPLADALIEGSDGELSVAILVADITLGILSGSSQLHIELGGVNAFTEGQRFQNPFDAIPVPPPTVGGTETIFIPGTPGTAGAPGAPAVAAPDQAEFVAAPGPQIRTFPGDKGGPAMLAGIIGLATAMLLAAADWYRMRRRAAAQA